MKLDLPLISFNSFRIKEFKVHAALHQALPALELQLIISLVGLIRLDGAVIMY